MKNTTVLPVQLSVLKTIIVKDDFASACELISKQISWHDETQDIVEYLNKTVQNGYSSFAYQLHKDLGEKWVKDLDNAYIYGSSNELEQAKDILIAQAKKYTLLESLNEVIASDDPLNAFSGLHNKIVSNLTDKNVTYNAKSLTNTIYKERQKEVDENGLLGLPTGFPEIDRVTFGMQGGHFWVMGAATSSGKTWLAMQMLLNGINSKKEAKGLYLSLELSAGEMFSRVVANMSGSSLSDIKISKSDFIEKKIKDTCKELEEKDNLYINDSCYYLHQIIALIYQYMALGVKYFVIDYVQNIMLDDGSNEYERLNKIVITLQSLAREKGIFVLLLTQFNRESVKSARKVSDLFQSKGSGNIENSADYMLKIDVDKDDRTLVELKVVKNRILGELSTQYLKGDFSIARYLPITTQLDPEEVINYIK